MASSSSAANGAAHRALLPRSVAVAAAAAAAAAAVSSLPPPAAAAAAGANGTRPANAAAVGEAPAGQPAQTGATVAKPIGPPMPTNVPIRPPAHSLSRESSPPSTAEGVKRRRVEDGGPVALAPLPEYIPPCALSDLEKEILTLRYRGPSVDDGMNAFNVIRVLRLSCLLIKRTCKAINVNLLAMCTAQVFLQRFFASQSLRRHDRFLVAVACIFLACKAEENVKDMNELLNAAHRVRFNVSSLRLSDDEAALKSMQNNVIKMERIVLQTLSFDIATEHPQGHLHRLAKKICQDTVDTSELIYTAWCIANDSFSTNVCLYYTPSAVATACILLAAKFLKERTDESAKFRAAVDQVLKAEKRGTVGDTSVGVLKSIMAEILFVYKDFGEWSSAAA